MKAQPTTTTLNTTLKTIPFNELPDKMKEKVVLTFRGWLKEVYNIEMVLPKQIGEMFTQLNTPIEFYRDAEGKGLFRVEDSDERLARFLGEQFAAAAKYDPGITDKIIRNMIKRNDGDERLKIV